MKKTKGEGSGRKMNAPSWVAKRNAKSKMKSYKIEEATQSKQK